MRRDPGLVNRARLRCGAYTGVEQAQPSARSTGRDRRPPKVSAVERTGDHRRGRRRAAVLLTVAAVLVPAVSGRSSFPLSDYPIYAEARPRLATFATARGIAADGSWVELGMATIARTDDPLIAQSRLQRATATEAAAAQLCGEIARRVGDRVVAIELARERHDLVAGAGGDPSMLAREPVARCEVER